MAHLTAFDAVQYSIYPINSVRRTIVRTESKTSLILDLLRGQVKESVYLVLNCGLRSQLYSLNALVIHYWYIDWSLSRPIPWLLYHFGSHFPLFAELPGTDAFSRILIALLFRYKCHRTYYNRTYVCYQLRKNYFNWHICLIQFLIKVNFII